MNLIDLKTGDWLGKYTAYGFYNDKNNLIDIVISGDMEFVKNNVFDALKNIDNICFTFDIQDLQESTDTQYAIQSISKEAQR